MACREEIRTGNKWAPDFADFMAMVNKSDEADIDGAFDRMIKRDDAIDNIEYNTRQDVGYRCKTQLSEKDARKLFKDTYIKYQQKVRQGEFIADKDQLTLPESSQVTEVDKLITEREGKPQTAIEKRMMNILNKTDKE